MPKLGEMFLGWALLVFVDSVYHEILLIFRGGATHCKLWTKAQIEIQSKNQLSKYVVFPKNFMFSFKMSLQNKVFWLIKKMGGITETNDTHSRCEFGMNQTAFLLKWQHSWADGGSFRTIIHTECVRSRG